MAVYSVPAWVSSPRVSLHMMTSYFSGLAKHSKIILILVMVVVVARCVNILSKVK